MIAGPGKSTLLKLPTTDGASACRITIFRLPAAGPDPAGTWDDDPNSATFQTYLHLRVVFPTEGANRCVDNADAIYPLTDFDPEGVEIFPPECSQVTLVGGKGRYSVMAEAVPIIAEGYAPRSRRLLRMLERRAQFTVPPGHAGIGTLDARALLTNISDGGRILLTSSWPSLIAAGTILANLNANPVLVWTAFNA
jgi:hypothetical protein